MEGRDINVNITTGTVVKTIAILALAWLIYTLWNLVLIVLTSIVIASAIEPGAAGLVRRKIPRVLAVIIMYVLVLSVLFVLFYFFLPSVFGDLSAFLTAIPTYLNTFTQNGQIGYYARIFGIAVPSSVSSTDIMTSIGQTFNIGTVFQNAFTLISVVFGGVFSFILIVVLSFYFAVVDTGVDDFLRIIVPQPHELLRPLAPKVDVAVLPAEILVDRGLLVHIERRGLRFVQDGDRGRRHLDPAGR